MGCIDQMKYDILLSKVSFRECSAFIESHFDEVYTVQPGHKMFDVFIVGIPPIYVGVEDDHVIFPYTKPCHGTFLLRIRSPEEIEKLRTSAVRLK